MNDYENLKKKYGEKFAKLCRTLFPTILEKEGLLSEIIESKFAPNKSLYEDITQDGNIAGFKDFIYFNAPNIQRELVSSKEKPQKLMSDAGYVLIKCKTHSDILKFKKFYSKDEELCTFTDKYRIHDYHVFFAIKKNVNEIKREDFKNPERQDEYGTSVISIQFSKGIVNTISIKNRYNHTVKNPDATFSNDLENIIPGLTQSFAKYYKLNLRNQVEEFRLENYVIANDGKAYKYNYRIDDVYYCPNNIVIKGKKPVQYDKNKYILVDYFLIDKENKTITNLLTSPFAPESFCDYHKNIKKIDVTKIGVDGNRKILITFEDDKTATIIIDENNKMVEYHNSHIKEIGNDFLRNNLYLKKFSAENLTSVGNNFLRECVNIKHVNISNVTKIGDCALAFSSLLEELSLPNVIKIGTDFCYNAKNLKHFSADKLKEVGGYFLFRACDLTQLDLPSLEYSGDEFLGETENLLSLDAPKLKELSNGALKNAFNLQNLNIPSVKIIANNVLMNVKQLKVINLPKVKSIGYYFMCFNESLKEINIPNVEIIDSWFLRHNKDMEKFDAPKLEYIEQGFMEENKGLVKFDAPNLVSIMYGFLHKNRKLTEFNAPKIKKVSHNILSKNPRMRRKIKKQVDKNLGIDR